MKIRNNTIDIIAFTSSIICAIHCAAIPIVLSFSSLSSLHFLENPYIEWTFIALGVIFVFMSLCLYGQVVRKIITKQNH